jgi:hypothetical protein
VKHRFKWHACALVCVLSLLGGASSAQAVGVTGISDQNIGNWSSVGVWWSTGLGHVRQARYNAPWNIAESGSTGYAPLVTWLNSVASLGLTPLVSFNYTASGGPPSAAAYATAVHQFRTMWPQVTEFTAWNEPNHHPSNAPGGNPADDPALAAQYWNALNTECQTPVGGSACTVAAGDFLDGTPGDPGFLNYLSTYKNNLDATPSVWALHPYSAVNQGNTTNINTFLAATGSARVWFTEVGAYYCNGGTPAQNAATQRQAAMRINQYGAAYSRVDRIYYYQFAFAVGSPASCPNGDWDTSLLDANDVERPALKVIRGGSPIPALFRNGQWLERFGYSSGDANRVVAWGQAGDKPVMGDWDGDGVKTPGVLRGNVWWLTNDPVATDQTRWTSFTYGSPGDSPVVGDWDGNGTDTIGVKDGNTYFLRNTNSTGPADIGFTYGDAADTPVVGDWDGNGTDTIGVVRGNLWFVRNSLTTGNSDDGWAFGDPGDLPVVGDWYGTGVDEPGVYRNGAWYLGPQHGTNSQVSGFFFGQAGDQPATGG